jgi:hypothetical protein
LPPHSRLERLGATASMLGPGWKQTKSVSLWVKPAGTSTCTGIDPGTCDAIFGDRPRLWGISRGPINGVDRLRFWNRDGNYHQIAVPYTPGEWTHLALVHSGGF